MVEIYALRQKGPRGSGLNSRGMALVLCLLLMTTLCLIGGAALSIAQLNHKIVHNGTKQVQAFYTAEAGRELALSYLREDPMWRGTAPSVSPGFEDAYSIGGVEAAFQITLYDCTADENGIYNTLLAPGHVMVKSTGTFLDAVQSIECIARVDPADGSAAAFPQAAVVSAGSVTGPLTILDDLGAENSLLLKAPTTLPEGNAPALKAMAEWAFPVLDNDAWDAALGGIGSFWLDSPADTRPRILYIQGDLDISGARQLHGIVFVEGKDVTLEDESGVHGILYAPNATSVTVQNSGASGRIVVFGQIITGSGGVTVSGNQASFQHGPDYVKAFNIAAGSKVGIEVVPGSWGMH